MVYTIYISNKKSFMDWVKSLEVEISTGEVELPEEPVDEELKEARERDAEIEQGDLEQHDEILRDALMGAI